MLVLVFQKPARGLFMRPSMELERVYAGGRNLLLLTAFLPAKLGIRRGRRFFIRCRNAVVAARGTEILLHSSVTAAPFLSMLPAPDTRPFIEASAVDAVKSASVKRGTALFATDKADTASLTALRKLCRSYRFVLVDAPPHVERRLTREAELFGVTLSPAPRRGTVAADAAVVFSRPTRPIALPDDCPVAASDPQYLEKLSGGRAVDIEIPYQELFGIKVPVLTNN